MIARRAITELAARLSALKVWATPLAWFHARITRLITLLRTLAVIAVVATLLLAGWADGCTGEPADVATHQITPTLLQAPDV